jgi:hypothetical protein
VSIATDNSNNTEAFPISADAYVYWYPGNSPIVSNPIPANHAVDVLPIITYWNCTITDVEGDPFNFTIQFFNATMVLLKSYSENSSSNGTKSINISGLLNTSRIYYIKVNCTDIDGSPQYLFDFTTIDYYIYYLFTYSTSMDGRRFVFTSHVYTNVNIDFVNWRFGDGGTSQIFNPVHYYGASGNFNCIGTVENVSRGISATYTALFTFQPVVVPSVLNNPLLNLDWTFFYYMVVILIILVLVIIVVTLAKRSGGRR